MQNKKRHLLQLILKKILQKFKIREKAVVLMEEEVRKYMELEDGKSDLSFVETSSNVLKRKSNETKQEI